jgi:hypothetical protein
MITSGDGTGGEEKKIKLLSLAILQISLRILDNPVIFMEFLVHPDFSSADLRRLQSSLVGLAIAIFSSLTIRLLL